MRDTFEDEDEPLDRLIRRESTTISVPLRLIFDSAFLLAMGLVFGGAAALAVIGLLTTIAKVLVETVKAFF